MDHKCYYWVYTIRTTVWTPNTWTNADASSEVDNDQSVPTNVVHYMISIQDCLSQTKELASENGQKSKVKYKSCYYRKAKERTFRAGELVLIWTPLTTDRTTTGPTWESSIYLHTGPSQGVPSSASVSRFHS